MHGRCLIERYVARRFSHQREWRSPYWISNMRSLEKYALGTNTAKTIEILFESKLASGVHPPFICDERKCALIRWHVLPWFLKRFHTFFVSVVRLWCMYAHIGRCNRTYADFGRRRNLSRRVLCRWFCLIRNF